MYLVGTYVHIYIHIYIYYKVNLSSFQPLPILFLFLPELAMPGPGERATHQGDLGQGRERGLDGESPD